MKLTYSIPEYTPLSALELGHIFNLIKLPKGVVNIVNGDGISTGNPLISHPDIDKVSFTGSGKINFNILKI